MGRPVFQKHRPEYEERSELSISKICAPTRLDFDARRGTISAVDAKSCDGRWTTSLRRVASDRMTQERENGVYINLQHGCAHIQAHVLLTAGGPLSPSTMFIHWAAPSTTRILLDRSFLKSLPQRQPPSLTTSRPRRIPAILSDVL